MGTLVTMLAGAALIASGGPVAHASQACTGRLQVQGGLSSAVGSRGSAPVGFDFATQPNEQAVTAGGAVRVFGYALRDRACRVGGAGVVLSYQETGRQLVERRRASTGPGGEAYSTVLRPVRTGSVHLTVTAGDETATASPLGVPVQSTVSAAFATPGGCRVQAVGSTYPAATAHPVWLQRRVVIGGRERGYQTLVRGWTDGDGRYRLIWDAPCGQSNQLATWLPPTASDLGARSTYVQLDVRARR